MRPRKSFPKQSHQRLPVLLQQAETVEEFKRIQCVWMRAALDMSVAEISTAIGLSPASVRCFHSRYLKRGVPVLLGRPRGGRRHQNLTLEQERQLLAEFVAEAKRGGLLEVGPIRQAYEKALARQVPKSTVYRMLARHGWRKLAPRPRHPDSDAGRREEFKKNFPRWWPPK